MSKKNVELKFVNDMLRAENEALKDALRALVGRAVIDTRCLDDDIDAEEIGSSAAPVKELHVYVVEKITPEIKQLLRDWGICLTDRGDIVYGESNGPEEAQKYAERLKEWAENMDSGLHPLLGSFVTSKPLHVTSYGQHLSIPGVIEFKSRGTEPAIARMQEPETDLRLPIPKSVDWNHISPTEISVVFANENETSAFGVAMNSLMRHAKETKLRLEEEARPLVVLKSCVENFLKRLDALASFDAKNASSVFVSSSERFELWKLVRNAREDLMKAMR